MGNVTESIFDGETRIIPLAEVLFIEKDLRKVAQPNALVVVFKGSTWDRESDYYNNVVHLIKEEAASFRKAWCRYRSELESETLADITPAE